MGMKPACYVGRVGGLAVALGVGAAVVTGSPGLAWAETPSSESSSSDSPADATPADTTDPHGDTTPEQTPDEPDDPPSTTTSTTTSTSTGSTTSSAPPGIVVSTGGALPSADEDEETDETTETVAPTETATPGTGTHRGTGARARIRRPAHRRADNRTHRVERPARARGSWHPRDRRCGCPAHRRACCRRRRAGEFPCRADDVSAIDCRGHDHGDDADGTDVAAVADGIRPAHLGQLCSGHRVGCRHRVPEPVHCRPARAAQPIRRCGGFSPGCAGSSSTPHRPSPTTPRRTPKA